MMPTTSYKAHRPTNGKALSLFRKRTKLKFLAIGFLVYGIVTILISIQSWKLVKVDVPNYHTPTERSTKPVDLSTPISPKAHLENEVSESGRLEDSEEDRISRIETEKGLRNEEITQDAQQQAQKTGIYYGRVIQEFCQRVLSRSISQSNILIVSPEIKSSEKVLISSSSDGINTRNNKMTYVLSNETAPSNVVTSHSIT